MYVASAWVVFSFSAASWLRERLTDFSPVTLESR